MCKKLLTIITVGILMASLLYPSAAALEMPQIAAEAYILADMDSGNILCEKNMTVRRSPASLTKIMTGLLAVEAVERGEIGLEDRITAPADCWTGMDSDSSNAEINPGEVMSFQDYLYCALVKSANEACNVIAVAVSGSIGAFVSDMNRRATELGAEDTFFSDTNGLASANHYTTAKDLFLITREAMRHELFAEAVDTLSYEIEQTNKHEKRVLKNSNALLTMDGVYGDDYLYLPAAGVKTGYTRAAGYCLVSTAEKNGVRLLAVLLGCGGPMNTGEEHYGNFTGTIRLYDWGFQNFSKRQIIRRGEVVTSLPVQYAKDNRAAVLCAVDSTELLLPKEMDENEIHIAIDPEYKELEAPIAAGTLLGKARVEINGQTYASVRLATASAVERDTGRFLRAKFEEQMTDPIKLLIALAAVIAFVVIILQILGGQIRRRRRREAEEEELLRKRRQQELEENRMQSLQAQEEMKQFRRKTGDDAFPVRNSAERYPLAGRKEGKKTEETENGSMEDLFS